MQNADKIMTGKWLTITHCSHCDIRSRHWSATACEDPSDAHRLLTGDDSDEKRQGNGTRDHFDECFGKYKLDVSDDPIWWITNLYRTKDFRELMQQFEYALL